LSDSHPRYCPIADSANDAYPEENVTVGIWIALFWTFVIAGGVLALYALHRLGLWMEERGYIYYWRKKPTGSAAGAFVALQKIIEPQAQHVIEVARVNHLRGDEEPRGQGDPKNPENRRDAQETG
jgi:hypothetical protein